jgi:hypothetical protein
MKYFLYDQQGDIVADIVTDHKLQRGMALLLVDDGVYTILAQLIIPTETTAADAQNWIVNKISRPVSSMPLYERPTERTPLTLKSTQGYTPLP